MTLSAESKNGSPNEAGTPVMRHSAMPPIESLLACGPSDLAVEQRRVALTAYAYRSGREHGPR